jgi:type IV pilus assembly protein PilZ
VQEKRRFERKPVEFAVEFSVLQGGRVAGLCSDISVGGMRIQTQSPAPFGATVTIYAELPGARGTSVLPGVVRWAKQGEMGVQFEMLGARETHAITQVLGG